MINRKNIIKITYIIFAILIILSLSYVIRFYYDMYNIQKQSLLLNKVSLEQNEVSSNEYKPQKSERMLKLEKLQKENSDIVGWLEIENTNINYPVLQGSDNDFYLDHNYKKKKAKGGSIFLDYKYSWNPPSSNLLIYGHNMSNSTMFENLFKYKDKKFYDENPNIRFTTINRDEMYEIIAVLKSSVYYGSDPNVFEYYMFVNAKNEEEYNYYVDNVKKLSLYDTGKTAKYGDQLMTLSTCSYHTEDGRFAVVARSSR